MLVSGNRGARCDQLEAGANHRLCFAAISVAASTLSFSQTITSGDVTGTVSDSSGGVVPNATVTIQSAATGTSNAVQSGGDGAYGFNFVSPGTLSAFRC
jgi:succinyl-CoA synthetase alpha subunit